MQQFAVIGLGRFGLRLAVNLATAGQQVIAVDRNVRLVEEIRDRVTLAVALDATDEEALRAQGIDQVDVAVVGIGDDFEARVLTTVILKQLGVARVISRAITPIGTSIMKRVGADEVVNPENESADRWAVRLAHPWFLSHFELDPGYSIVEINTPASWAGKTLAQLQLRKEMDLHVVAVKHFGTDQVQPRLGRPTLRVPRPDDPLGRHDVLMVMGSDEDLSRLPT